MKRKFKLGVLVNPFAGIGGALAMKGSDGRDVREHALRAGATIQAPKKMRLALDTLTPYQSEIEIYTVANDMGETSCIAAGLDYQVVFSAPTRQTEGTDTEEAASALLEQGIDLLIFAGGDGTARNIYSVVRQRVPVLGIPAGCKIHSGVYAVTPSAAGKVSLQMIQGNLVSESVGEVRDIDENAFRGGKVIAKHYGEMRIPEDLHYVQSVKMGGQESDELVLADIVDDMCEIISDEPDTYFIMGSGSTVAAVMKQLELPNTLLGVDVLKDGNIVIKDATAVQLEQLIELNQTIKIVITVIGGQGHILGRGNQQLSPTLVRAVGKTNLCILASKSKLNSLDGRPMRSDTGDAVLDAELAGPTTVIAGYHDRVLYPLE